MDNSYVNAPQTIMLATSCVCCGLPLVDAVSVEMGIGPDCRRGAFPDGVTDADRMAANKLVHLASLAASAGKAQEVVELAAAIREIGFDVLADKVGLRFVDNVRWNGSRAKIVIEESNGELIVKTPFKRSCKDEFIRAWQAVPGRRFDRNKDRNHVPVAARRQVWDLLRRFFPGEWGRGPKGAFRVPKGA